MSKQSSKEHEKLNIFFLNEQLGEFNCNKRTSKSTQRRTEQVDDLYL